MDLKDSHLVPQVIERTGMGETRWDIYSRLLKDRVVFLDGEINEITADLIIAQFLFLESQDPDRDINLYINSPGGSVTAGLAIYDTMHYIRPDINTICVGQAASMGAVLLAGGTKGKRGVLPSARVMVHQPWGGVQGQARDIKIQAQEIIRLKKMLTEYIAEDTGKSFKTVAADLERDLFMSAEEALAYGIVDKIFVRKN